MFTSLNPFTPLQKIYEDYVKNQTTVIVAKNKDDTNQYIYDGQLPVQKKSIEMPTLTEMSTVLVISSNCWTGRIENKLIQTVVKPGRLEMAVLFGTWAWLARQSICPPTSKSLSLLSQLLLLSKPRGTYNQLQLIGTEEGKGHTTALSLKFLKISSRRQPKQRLESKSYILTHKQGKLLSRESMLLLDKKCGGKPCFLIYSFQAIQNWVAPSFLSFNVCAILLYCHDKWC